MIGVCVRKGVKKGLVDESVAVGVAAIDREMSKMQLSRRLRRLSHLLDAAAAVLQQPFVLHAVPHG